MCELVKQNKTFSKSVSELLTTLHSVEMWWHTVTHGRGSEGGNWRLEWVASTLHTTSEHGVSIRLVIPVVIVNKLHCGLCTCLTQFYDGRYMYIIYYIKNNYIFRHFSLAIFRLINEKNLVSSYTRLVWVVYSGEVRGEVGTRSRMCCVGWVVWVHGFCYFCYV